MSDEKTLKIPPEIWLTIWQKLPVKTIGQCLCVCKPWNTLITSSSFVAAHTENSSQVEGNSLLLYRQFTNAPKKNEEYMFMLDSSQKESDLEPCYTLTCPFVIGEVGNYFRVVGTVNGLICLSDDLFGYTYLTILWNPLLRKYIRLPVPRVNYVVKGAHISSFGFGYDTRKASHKVVRISYMREKNAMYDVTPPTVELYSVKEGRWRYVPADSLVNICICDYWWSQCFLNGAVHWVAWERDASNLAFSRNWFLIFDVEEEKFKKMKLPDALAKVCTLDLSVAEYCSKLSVLHSVLKGGAVGNEMERCEIWVKGEYTVGSSWSKVVSIDINSSAGLGWVQCLRKNGDVLGFSKKGELVSYDPLMERTKGLGVRGCWRSWFTCSFTESLILLDRKKGVGTYDKTGGKKKKFKTVFSNGMLDMEEIEVDGSSVGEKDQSSGQCNSVYHQGKFVLLEQLSKFDGTSITRDPSEYMSMAGFEFSEFMSMAESVAWSMSIGHG
ncbi:F-box/kelch-repeat protein At3g23880-like [Chenopodium quinoa]|uniref:F-box/kelch-repeat protein At3g23880-like n=1 Tax=Chenopodium quinoa TaxID=63459 RepID=UPI000B78E513|nr:F-box/kelch-repeat protein At3g23880-like [Chenopodium quinoa]XP_021752003.1 F-box/kelch-repeat protein At3g23880-like [Chenopodium quinoa]